MGETWSIYISDDEKNEKIKELLDGEDYHNQAHLFSKAVGLLIEEEFPERHV